MFRPVRHAARSLLNSPGFTTIALLTLALAIGVNSSMYTLTKTLLFTNAPFPRAEEVFDLQGRNPNAEIMSLSKLEIDDLVAQNNPAIKVMAAYHGTMETVSLPGQLPEQLQGTAAEAAFFAVTEVPPILGRPFTADECVPGRDTVVLLTEKFWNDSFGRSPDVLSKSLRINGRLHTIIGVVPNTYRSQFIFGESLFLRPLTYSPEQANNRDRREKGVMVRLNPQASPISLIQNYAGVVERWSKDFPTLYENYSLWARQTGRVPGAANERLSFLLLGLAVAILAIACANLANLQLARANARLRDLAIRSALGASRFDLIKHQLVESLVLSIAGGALGLLVATWSNQLIGSNIRIGINGHLPLELDQSVILYNALASVIAGLGFGLIPALLASRTDVNDALKTNARGSTGGRSHGWIRQFLVVTQVALSLALLSLAGMMVLGLRTIVNERPAWDSEKLLTANLAISETDYASSDSRRALYQALLQRFATIPGIEASTLASHLPTGNGSSELVILKEDQDASAGNLPYARSYLITSDYFRTLGIALLEGSGFPAEYRTGFGDKILVNRALAEAYWTINSAVGKRLGIRSNDGKVEWKEVIGVVADADDAIVFNAPRTRFQIYGSLLETPWGWFQIGLRGDNPKRFANDLRRAVSDLSPDMVPRFIWTVQDMRDLFLHNIAIVNGVVLAFALLGLVIASVGLAGVVAQGVNQRLNEFGIRLALGAMPGDLLRLVMRQGVVLTSIGLTLGLLLGLGLTRIFPADIARMVAVSPWMLAGTTAIIGVVSLLATWLPARRATSADPMAALRAE